MAQTSLGGPILVQSFSPPKLVESLEGSLPGDVLVQDLGKLGQPAMDGDSKPCTVRTADMVQVGTLNSRRRSIVRCCSSSGPGDLTCRILPARAEQRELLV